MKSSSKVFSGMLVPILLFIGILTGLFLIRSPVPGPSTGTPGKAAEPLVIYSGRTNNIKINIKKQDFGLKALLVPGISSHQADPPGFPGGNAPQISNEGVSFGGARRIAIQESIAYVADWFSGLHLYDIRNPGEPALLSSFHTPGSPKDVLVHETHAFVADDDFGLSIIDIKNPKQPNLVSRLQTPGLAYGMALSGNLLYLASHREGFQIIDIEDIQNPRIISDVPTLGLAWGIDVRDQTVFIAADTSGIQIYDARDPRNPEKIGEFYPGGQAEDVLIRGDHAFAVFFDRGLYILDVKDPSRPNLIAHLPTPGNSRGLDIIEGYALIADWKAGIQIVDINNLTQPEIVARYDTKGAAWGVRVKGTEVFVMDWWGGLTVIDIGEPASPRHLGAYHGRGTIEDLAVKGTYAFLAAGTGGLQVFDIRNPFNPMWVTGLDETGNAQSIIVDNQFAYVGSANVGSDGYRLSIVDVSNPFQLRLISETETSLPAKRIEIKNGRAYLSDLKTGFLILDLSDPSRPVETASYPGRFNDFGIDGDILYLATDEGLELHKVTDPRSLIRVDRLSTENPARLLQIRNREIYLYEEEIGIRIYFIKDDKAEPLSAFIPGEPLRGMKLSGDTLYAMTESSTLMALDISNPRAVSIRGLVPSDIKGDRLAISEDAVFFAGEKILRAIKPPPEARVVQKQRGNFEISLLEDMPVGIYHLALMGSDGKRKGSPDIIQVALPAPEEELSLEDYKKLLKEQCPACPQ